MMLKINAKQKYVGIILLSVCGVVSVAAAPLQNKVIFDFKQKQIIAYGIFEPKSDSGKSGLDAENDARKVAVAIATEALKSQCTNSKYTDKMQSKLGKKEGWVAYFRSQGSEIFPKGVLRIKLSALFSNVYNKYPGNNAAIFEQEKSKYVFKIPLIPSTDLECGLATLVLNKVETKILPIPVGKIEGDVLTIDLSLKGGRLVPSSTKDEELLKNSKFLDTASANTAEVYKVLPIH